jgi:flagellar hook-length control protein FliK
VDDRPRDDDRPRKADDKPEEPAVGSRQSAEKVDDKPAKDPEKDQPAATTDAPATDAKPVADKPATVPAEILAQLAPVKQDEKPVAVKAEAAAASKPAGPAVQAQVPAKAEPAAGGPQSAGPVAQPQTPVDPAKVAADAKPAETAPVAPQPDAGKPAAEPRVQQAPVAQPQQQSKAGGQSQQPGQESQQQGQQGSLPQPASEQARTVAQAYGRNTSTEVPTTVQSGTPTAAPAAPVASAQPAAARGEFAPATPVPLARAAENVEHVLLLAQNRGVTHARIALTPESLGSIDVHLRHTAEGVVAKVVAHSADAAQQLQQAAADLRRQLDSQGVNVLSLDIGQSSADDRSAAGAGASFGDAQGGNSDGSSADDESAGADAETTVNSTLQLPNGVLVDVLA